MAPRRGVVLVLALLLIGQTGSSDTAGKCTAKTVQPPSFTPAVRLKGVHAVWQQRRHVNASTLEQLRAQAWAMFDHGFSNYMKHAFPQDNLLPVSCKGQDWQGGLGLTLVDSLDMLLLLNRRGDVQAALEQLRQVLSFDKDVKGVSFTPLANQAVRKRSSSSSSSSSSKVHVFETTIRVLGGLLSGHMLLADDPGLAPGYDGLLLRLAADLGGRLMFAFDTPSGLPGGHVHLQKGLLAGENISCTACAGTLLLEFGLLSRLTGEPAYEAAARHAARVLFDQRSELGLVGSGFHVFSRTWSHRGSTIGPGSDSYYEYLLKAYLMFGDEAYLSMFTELYVATMRHMQVPGQLGASSSAFLLDVHMDSGRLLKPWVLAGQNEAAERLHSNFTAAWATWGWLPEMFGADLSSVHPEDPGYNLRPEHIESTWYLKAVSGDPTGYYGGLAAAMMAVLNHSRVECGYAPIRDVKTGAATDLMESYFLSETVKYLYLSFVDSAPLLDYYLLSTEGHLMPAFPHGSDRHLREADLPQEHQQQQQQQQHGEQGHEEDYLDVDQGGAWGEMADYNDSQEPQAVKAGQQSTNCTGGAAAAAAAADPDASSGSCAAAAAGASSTTTPTSSTANSSSSSSSTSNPTTAAVDGGSGGGVGSTSGSLVGKPLGALPANCRGLCGVRSAAQEAALEVRLHAALPLLPVRRAYSRRIRYRRCVACLHTTEALLAKPPDSLAVRLARLNFGQSPSSSSGSKQRNTSPPRQQQQELQPAGSSVLAQVLCVLKVYKSGHVDCQTIRRLTALDSAVGLAPGTLLLQLTAPQPEPLPPAAAILAAFETTEGPVTMALPAVEAAFGLSRLALPCPLAPPGEPPAYLRPRSRPRSTEDVRRRRAALQREQRQVPQSGEPWWQVAARQADPWLGMSPRQGLCKQLAQQLTRAQQQPDAQHAQRLAAEQGQQCVAVHGARPGERAGAGIHQQQEQQQQVVDECVAAHEAEAAEQGEACTAGGELRSGPQRVAAADAASWGLVSACLGWDASSEAGGGWLLGAEWGGRGASCASLPAASYMPRAAPLVLAEPLHGCKGLRNAGLLRGALAVATRGGCSFVEKATAADAAGAVGVVVLNTLPPGELLTMSGDETGWSPDIPAILLGGEDSRALLWWLQHRPMMATAVAFQAGSRKALQLQHGQAQQQQVKGKGVSKGSEQQPPRVDLFVPAASQAWLEENIVKAGINLQRVYEQTVHDPQVVGALQQAAAGRLYFAELAAQASALHVVTPPSRQQLRQAYAQLQDTPSAHLADVSIACQAAGISHDTLQRVVAAGRIDTSRAVSVLEVLLLLLTMSCETFAKTMQGIFEVFGSSRDGCSSTVLPVSDFMALLGHLAAYDSDVSAALQQQVAEALSGQLDADYRGLLTISALADKLA
ncbi:glycoside hydrolase [Scenedesmus sp. NREL 46B-D3]|nr:glycoside hydrolase [Scenedesmus sp. NREL 46B-D3]